MSDLLFAIPENPLPTGIRAGTIAARDGVALRYAHLPATGRPLKGTVVVLAGRNEYIEKYFETFMELSARGFGAAMMDWRGQGGSGRMLRNAERGHVADFADYVSDLEQFFEEVVLPDCRGPFYVLAHSTGGLVALLAAPNLVNRVQRMVLTAPLLGFAGTRVPVLRLRRMAGLARGIGLGSFYFGGGRRTKRLQPFEGNVLTGDRRRFARNARIAETFPELGIGGPTASWVHSACSAIERVSDPDYAASLPIPVLMVAAGMDRVVSTRAIEDMARRLRSGRCLTIDGARHEILQETDARRDQFWAAFDAFVPGSEADA